jgi:hypothetical protein
MDSEVDSGTLILVDFNGTYKTDQFFKNVFIFTAITVTTISFINTTWDLIDRIQGNN